MYFEKYRILETMNLSACVGIVTLIKRTPEKNLGTNVPNFSLLVSIFSRCVLKNFELKYGLNG